MEKVRLYGLNVDVSNLSIINNVVLIKSDIRKSSIFSYALLYV